MDALITKSLDYWYKVSTDLTREKGNQARKDRVD